MVHHPLGADRADELVLEVLDARVEPEPLQLERRRARSEPRPLEAATDIGLLGHVVQPCEDDVGSARPEPFEEPPDVPGSTHGDHGDTVGRQGAAPPCGERLERTSIAHPLDEDDGARERFLSLLHLPARRVDNEPAIIQAMAEADETHEILFLHADTIFESQRVMTPRTVTGSTYDLAELVSEQELRRRVQFVWHGVNDEANLRQFLASGVHWAEC